jgi:phosphatidylglycerol---prolipoprotein diacylglyceryl transferase
MDFNCSPLAPFGISNIAVSLGPVDIRWYALAYLAGFVFAWWYIHTLAKRPALWQAGEAARSPLSAEAVEDLFFWSILGVLVGGRLGYVIFYNPGYYLANPLEIPMLWKAGMSFHGGFLGVCAAVIWVARRHKLALLNLADAAAVATPLGLCLGRLANFVNGELWGRKWDGPWAIVFPCDPSMAARHPSQLYQAALEGLLLFLVLLAAVWIFKVLRRPGTATGIFLFGYGLARIAMETVREPDTQMPDFPLGLTMGMILSLPMLMIGAWLWLRARKTPSGG